MGCCFSTRVRPVRECERDISYHGGVPKELYKTNKQIFIHTNKVIKLPPIRETRYS
jgi:hypothetical protein